MCVIFFVMKNLVKVWRVLTNWSYSTTQLKEEKDCPIALRMCQKDVNPLEDFVFLNKEKKEVQDFFFKYDCIIQDLHVRILFDDFTMGVI